MPMLATDFKKYLLPLAKVRERMTEVVEYGVRRGDLDEPEPFGGYSIKAGNSAGEPSYLAMIDAHGGGKVDPRVGYRSVEFRTGDNPEVIPPIVTCPIFKAILKVIVSAWEVGYAQAYSEALIKHLMKRSKHSRQSLDLAWMTYVCPEMARKVAPPHDVLVERLDNGGLLMIATEEKFDVANPEHLAAAQSIVDSLAWVNAEEERKANLLWPSYPSPRHQ
jgi:Immunity protein 52